MSASGSGAADPEESDGDRGRPTNAEIEARLHRVGSYSRFVRAGLGVIATAFVLSVVVLLPENLDSPPAAIEAILQPLIFLGMGLLLFGIGMHLHLLHLNVVRGLQEGGVDGSERRDRGGGDES